MWLNSTANAFLIDLIDGVMLGIPSSILLPRLSQDFDIAIEDMNRLYKALTQEYNTLSSELSSKQEIKDNLRDALYNTGPIGQIRQDLETKYSKASKDVESVSTKLNEVSKSVDTTAADLQNAELVKRRKYGSLGSWFKDESDKLTNSNRKEKVL